MIHLVTALRAEATPFIDALRLRSLSGSSGRLFEGDDLRLAISGVGRSASSRASRALHQVSGGEQAVWLNVGVAAHRALPIGQAVVGHKIVEAASGACWYPRLIVAVDMPSATIRTVDEAIESPEGDEVFEMEASGFFSAAMEWTTAELAGCVKVISDHGVSDAAPFQGDVVGELIAPHVEETLALGRSIEQVMHDSLPRLAVVDLDPVFERWHFTVTQQRMLASLARRAQALEASLDHLLPATADSARQVLAHLEAGLDALASAGE